MNLLGVVKRIVHFDVVGVAGCLCRRWWWLEHIADSEVTKDTLLAFLANRPIVSPFGLDDLYVLQCLLNCSCFFSLCRVGCSENRGAVLLTLPAQIRAWFHDKDRGHKLAPEVIECGV